MADGRVTTLVSLTLHCDGCCPCQTTLAKTSHINIMLTMMTSQDRLRARLAGELLQDTDTADQKIFKGIQNVPPDPEINATVKMLLAECLGHKLDDLDRSKTTGFKSWNGNPFIPLFLEWEATYYHIDFTKWDISVRSSSVGNKDYAPYAQVRYGISQELGDADQGDWRLANGRVLILPQPVFSLKAAVQSVIDRSDSPITAAQKADLLANIDKVKFISAPLQGFTDHLLTRTDGAHVKPNFKKQGQVPVPLEAAVRAGTYSVAGLSPFLEEPVREALKLVLGETGLCPYGNLLDFGKDEYPDLPFKGVTHGQAVITNLNIVDKFGQAICVPQPKPRPRRRQGAPPSVLPCVSDYLLPNKGPDGFLNTVYQEPDKTNGPWPVNRFLQLPPSINQEARLNMAFVKPTYDAHRVFQTWQETTDYEQP